MNCGFDTLRQRGFIQQMSSDWPLRYLMEAGPVATSLHAGSLMPIMAMRHLQCAYVNGRAVHDVNSRVDAMTIKDGAIIHRHEKKKYHRILVRQAYGSAGWPSPAGATLPACGHSTAYFSRV
jgi:hypothetical protein